MGRGNLEDLDGEEVDETEVIDSVEDDSEKRDTEDSVSDTESTSPSLVALQEQTESNMAFNCSYS